MTAVGSCVKLNDDYTWLPSSSFPLPSINPRRTTASFFPSCHGIFVGIHVDDSIAPAISGILYATVPAIIEYLLFHSPYHSPSSSTSCLSIYPPAPLFSVFLSLSFSLSASRYDDDDDDDDDDACKCTYIRRRDDKAGRTCAASWLLCNLPTNGNHLPLRSSYLPGQLRKIRQSPSITEN